MAFKRHIHPAEIPPEITATSDLSAAAGSAPTDAQRLQWLLSQGVAWRECYTDDWQEGEWLYDIQDARSYIDSAMQEQNIEGILK